MGVVSIYFSYNCCKGIGPLFRKTAENWRNMSKTPVLRPLAEQSLQDRSGLRSGNIYCYKPSLKGGDSFCRCPRKRTVKTFSNCFLVFFVQNLIKRLFHCCLLKE